LSDACPEGFARDQGALAIVEIGAGNPCGITLALSHTCRRIITKCPVGALIPRPISSSTRARSS